MVGTAEHPKRGVQVAGSPVSSRCLLRLHTKSKGRTALRRQFKDHLVGTLGRLPVHEDVVAEVERQMVDERLNMLGSVAVDASASIVAREHVALRGQQSDGESQV